MVPLTGTGGLCIIKFQRDVVCKSTFQRVHLTPHKLVIWYCSYGQPERS